MMKCARSDRDNREDFGKFHKTSTYYSKTRPNNGYSAGVKNNNNNVKSTNAVNTNRSNGLYNKHLLNSNEETEKKPQQIQLSETSKAAKVPREDRCLSPVSPTPSQTLQIVDVPKPPDFLSFCLEKKFFCAGDKLVKGINRTNFAVRCKNQCDPDKGFTYPNDIKRQDTCYWECENAACMDVQSGKEIYGPIVNAYYNQLILSPYTIVDLITWIEEKENLFFHPDHLILQRAAKQVLRLFWGELKELSIDEIPHQHLTWYAGVARKFARLSPPDTARRGMALYHLQMAKGLSYIKEMFQAKELGKDVETCCVPEKFILLQNTVQRKSYEILKKCPQQSFEYNLSQKLWQVMDEQKYILESRNPTDIFSTTDMINLRRIYASYCNETAFEYEIEYVDSEIMNFKVFE